MYCIRTYANVDYFKYDMVILFICEMNLTYESGKVHVN